LFQSHGKKCHNIALSYRFRLGKSLAISILYFYAWIYLVLFSLAQMLTKITIINRMLHDDYGKSLLLSSRLELSRLAIR